MKIIDLYKKLDADDFCFAYLDNFSDSVTDSLISIQESRSDTTRKINKKVSYLVTECFQNIVRHAEKTQFDFDKLFALRSSNGHHSIITINPVQKEKKESLAKSLAELESLSPEELKQVYLNSLNNEGFSEKGGAGLGLIEMARKTKQAPKYQFEDMNEELSKFILELHILEAEAEETLNQNINSGELGAALKEDQTLMIQKGDFSQESVMSLFELIEKNLAANGVNPGASKKLYLLIELLQNMSANALESEKGKVGIFRIKLNPNGKLTFETGNYMESKDSQKLSDYLDSIKGLNKIELRKKYSQELVNGLTREEEDGHAGIGLLEILKLSNSNLDYEIDNSDPERSFITFAATV